MKRKSKAMVWVEHIQDVQLSCNQPVESVDTLLKEYEKLQFKKMMRFKNKDRVRRARQGKLL